MPQVQNESGRILAELVDRYQKAEKIKTTLALLKRYETVFRLPARIRQQNQDHEYEQVISDYRKAKALMSHLTATPGETVWHNLLNEVEKVVLHDCTHAMSHHLTAALFH